MAGESEYTYKVLFTDGRSETITLPHAISDIGGSYGVSGENGIQTVILKGSEVRAIINVDNIKKPSGGGAVTSAR